LVATTNRVVYRIIALKHGVDSTGIYASRPLGLEANYIAKANNAE
jgi:hypothetical protein